VISLLKTALEMERLEKFKRAAVDCYGLAITSTEENVIEFDEKQADRFRNGLHGLANQLSRVTTPEQLRKIQELFHEELHDYRDHTHEQIRRLRREVEAAASALEEFAGNSVTSGDDYEKTLKQSLQRLDAVSASDRIEDIRAAIREASSGILSSFTQMRAINQVAVAQLKDEIRLLHQKIQAGRRRTTVTEPTSGTWNRQEIDDRIDQLLSQDTSFCLVLVVLKNFRILASRNSSSVMEDAIHSLQARLEGSLGTASTLGRWTTNQFVAILDIPPSNAVNLSREVAQKLMEPYSFEEKGAPRTLSFQVAAGLVDHRTGADALKFHGRLEKLSVALGGGN
jgi:GGDEF domain-containing protein